jgi:hypothetical protein
MAAMPLFTFAQKVNYDKGIIKVDTQQIGQVEKIKDKESLGFTSTFELHAMDGKTLIIARVATDFEPDATDNTAFYYRFTFLTTNQTAIFSLSKLRTERSFAMLIGESGIIADNQILPDKLNELIARKARNPKVVVEYNLVKRDYMFPLLINGHSINKGNVQIGVFRDISTNADLDIYEFTLPSGLVVAKAFFKGGNAARNCTISTNKDQQSHYVAFDPKAGTYGNYTMRSENVDRNEEAIKKIAQWLIDKNYL